MSPIDPRPRLRPLLAAVLRATIGRPRLAWEALRLAAATAAPRWWAHRPFLPVPEPSYHAWRLTTAYGTPDGEITPEELREFLLWRIRMRRSRR